MTNIIAVAVVVLLLVYAVRKATSGAKQYETNNQQGAAFLASNKTLVDVIMTDSGMQYQIMEAGVGKLHPKASSKVKVHYHGTLLNGDVFDSSVDRGQPIEFALNQVITGWTEGLQLMVVGQKNRLFIPADLAYGKRAAGAIEPGSLLIFEVELLAIDGATE